MDFIYSVEEAYEILTGMLEESTGWKYLKSQKCLKKTVKDLVFEINFFGSKWNESHKSVEINADFRIGYKKFGKMPINVNNIVASLEYRPSGKNSESAYWFDISTKEKLMDVYEELNRRILESAVQTVNDFEEDFKEATKRLFMEHFDEYNVHLDFVADILGIDAVRDKAGEIALSLTDIQKAQVAQYLKGDRSKAWMMNRNNLKYIIDTNLI